MAESRRLQAEITSFCPVRVQNESSDALANLVANHAHALGRLRLRISERPVVAT